MNKITVVIPSSPLYMEIFVPILLMVSIRVLSTSIYCIKVVKLSSESSAVSEKEKFG